MSQSEPLNDSAGERQGEEPAPLGGTGAVNYWLFQANPKKYDLVAELRTQEEGAENDWTVSSYGNRMRAGDKVIFWVAGKEGGIYALGELAGEPYEREHQPTEEEIKQYSYLKAPQSVKYRYTRILDEPLLREDLKKHPVLRNMQIFKFANATNFEVTPEEWAAVQELLPRATVVNRKNKDVAREVLERLLPDESTRRLCLRSLADSVEEAHRTAEASWSVTLFPDHVRLNVGPIEVFVIRQDETYLLLDKETLSAEVRTSVKDAAREIYPEGYPAVPNSSAWAVSAVDILSALPTLKNTHLRLIKRAAERRKITVWQRSHSPGVLAYLREFLGRALPDPIYPAPSDKASVKAPADIDPRALITRSLEAYGFHFTARQIVMFYTALQVKGFVILSGISGTGKTKLAQHFAAMLPQPEAESTPSDEVVTVTVQPYMLKYGRA
jgi:predicted RNA-binding protein with PUA-like domain